MPSILTVRADPVVRRRPSGQRTLDVTRVMTDAGEITEILQRVHRGEGDAFTLLLSLVYEELRELAERTMHRERVDHTLQPTALVHEVYLKLLGKADLDWKNRAHFFGVAARVMRQILVDHARRTRAQKRGEQWKRRNLEGVGSKDSLPALDLLALDEALTRLREKDERMASAVELRYFAGLSMEETARALGITTRTVQRRSSAIKGHSPARTRHGSPPTHHTTGAARAPARARLKRLAPAPPRPPPGQSRQGARRPRRHPWGHRPGQGPSGRDRRARPPGRKENPLDTAPGEPRNH